MFFFFFFGNMRHFRMKKTESVCKSLKAWKSMQCNDVMFIRFFSLYFNDTHSMFSHYHIAWSSKQTVEFTALSNLSPVSLSHFHWPSSHVMLQFILCPALSEGLSCFVSVRAAGGPDSDGAVAFSRPSQEGSWDVDTGQISHWFHWFYWTYRSCL